MLLKHVSRIIFLNNSTKALNLIQRTFSSVDIGKRHPKPYDYEKKEYTAWSFDSSLERLSDNSLIITVDGNFGSGKSEFAKKLAKDIDFHYAKEINIEEMVFKKHNYNYREFVNNIVGNDEQFRLNTIDEWHLNPTFKNAIQMQYYFYYLRWMQYRTALLHLMSTGQGVVLERSPFSDQIVAQALYEHNYLSKEAYNFYKNDLVYQTICELWRPHVMIYLDKSPTDCLKTVRSTGQKYEKESQVYSLDLLKTVDRLYKTQFLPQYKDDVFILNYENRDGVKTDEVIVDLEAIDLNNMEKLHNWRIRRERDINYYRARLASLNNCLIFFTGCLGIVRVPELMIYGEEATKLMDILSEAHELEYRPGQEETVPLLTKMFPALRDKSKDYHKTWI